MSQNSNFGSQLKGTIEDIVSKKDKPELFILYRIIGNDLYPRHKKGQARENLRFILEHEKDFENCDKWWVVNRIKDKKEEEAILQLLKKFNKPHLHIPFIEDEYAKVRWDFNCLPDPKLLTHDKLDSIQHKRLMSAIYRLKINYVMNNNGARNVALKNGKKRAKWILPWDGNCFLTEQAWNDIYNTVMASDDFKYFVVPMTRIENNSDLLDKGFVPTATEEPQLIFRNDSKEIFNEDFYYGRRPKVELLWRLGVPGKWDRWKDEPWDLERRPLSNEADQVGGRAGWVARLISGNQSFEKMNSDGFQKRGNVRLDATINTIRNVDIMLSDKGKNQDTLSCLNMNVLKKEKDLYQSGELPIIDQYLVPDANSALERKPYSVVDKTTLPPSGNIHDYWHPAPYWWPDPNKDDGLPYINIDGVRVPGTRLYEKKSNKYDRTRIQRVFDDTFILCLAWFFTENIKYVNHASMILKRFFSNPSTAITPHLTYAQVRMGRNDNKGSGTGIIEMKDLYYYLDAVRLLNISGALSTDDLNNFKDWLDSYLKWLLESSQGNNERKAKNNHGIYYDLQVATIADFLNKPDVVYETIIRSLSRMSEHFASDGSQPKELKRTNTVHYCCFNIQGWLNMAELGRKWEADYWGYQTNDGANLERAIKWLLSHSKNKWPYKQISHFDQERFTPIKYASPHFKNTKKTSIYNFKPTYFPHDGIRPYWNLGNTFNQDC